MKKPLKEEIRSLALRTIKETPANYRCYEITRILKEQFNKKGLKLYVIDGYAFYCFGTFIKEFNLGNCELFWDNSLELKGSGNSNSFKKAELIKSVRVADKLSRKQKSLEKDLYWRISIRHSWAILAESGYLIDYHRSISPHLSDFPILKQIPILRRLCVGNLLIVSTFNKKPEDKAYICRDVLYARKAVQEGKFIHYPDTNYTVELCP